MAADSSQYEQRNAIPHGISMTTSPYSNLGLIPTLALSVAVIILVHVSNLAFNILISILGVHFPFLASLTSNTHRMLFVLSVFSLPLGTTMTLILASLTMPQSGIWPPSRITTAPRTFSRWFALALGFYLTLDLLRVVLGRPLVPYAQIQMYLNVGSPTLYFIVVALLAPIHEEILFRGFMFQGIRDSKIGILGAVITTTILWTVIHIHLDSFEITLLLLSGSLLATIRARSGMLYPSIVFHVTGNLVSVLETMILAK